MNNLDDMPQKCRECARTKVSRPHGKCYTCHELDFQESVLCDLNQCIQDEVDFKCYAFRPALRVVGQSKDGPSDSEPGFAEVLPKGSFEEILDSDKIKYERALALQKLKYDPDSIILQLKYHFVWNVTHRAAIFGPANDFIGRVYDTFLGYGETVGGFVNLLYLAPDHVHLYVESDGERSVEDMVHDIKGFSAKAILEDFPSLREQLSGEVGLWDEAYFVETVG